MASAHRDAFPSEMTEALQRVDDMIEWTKNYQPVLPATQTPAELVDAATDLDAQLASHAGLPEADAIDAELRDYISATFAGSITEPVDLQYNRQIDVEMHLDDYPALSIARSNFRTVLKSGAPTQPRDGDWRHELTIRKQSVAAKFNVELDLTPDEWAAL